MLTRIITGLFALLIAFATLLSQPSHAATNQAACTPEAKSSAGCRAENERHTSAEADATNFKPLFGQSQENGPTPQAISYPDFTYRHYWGFKNGSWTLTLTSPSIHAYSKVFVSISEVDAYGNRFVGGAAYTVHNVAPREGAVTIRVNVAWNSPIRLSADYLVLNS